MTHRVPADPKGREHGHAVVEQRSQNARKTRDGQAADELSELGDAQLPAGRCLPHSRPPRDPHVRDGRKHDPHQQEKPIPGEERRSPQKNPGGKRQLDSAVEVLELRHEADQSRDDDRQPHAQEHDGIDQVADDFRPQVGLMLQEGTEAGEDLFQEAAPLPGSNHRQLHGRKDIRVPAHGIGQTRSLDDVVGNPPHHGGQSRVGPVLGEKLQGPEERHPHPQQIRELSIGSGQVPGGNPPLEARSDTQRLEPDGGEIPPLELGQDRLLVGCLHRAGHLLASRIAGDVGEGRHRRSILRYPGEVLWLRGKESGVRIQC